MPVQDGAVQGFHLDRTFALTPGRSSTAKLVSSQQLAMAISRCSTRLGSMFLLHEKQKQRIYRRKDPRSCEVRCGEKASSNAELVSGGERGIRTPDRAFDPIT